MVNVWRLRGNTIRTAPCLVVWHSVLSQQHTHMSSSYRSSRLGLSHWDPYVMHRGGCLECITVTWWSGPGGIQALSERPTGFLQCFGLVVWPVKIVPEMTYNVSSGTLSLYTTTCLFCGRVRLFLLYDVTQLDLHRWLDADSRCATPTCSGLSAGTALKLAAIIPAAAARTDTHLVIAICADSQAALRRLTLLKQRCRPIGSGGCVMFGHSACFVFCCRLLVLSCVAACWFLIVLCDFNKGSCCCCCCCLLLLSEPQNLFFLR